MNSSNNLDDLNLIAEISRCILREKNIYNNLHKVLHLLNENLPCLRSLISIYNRKTGKIYLKDGCGIAAHERERGVYKLGEGITGRVIESGEAILVPNIANDERFLNKTGFELDHTPNLSFLCVPIKSDMGTIGSLSAYLETNNDDYLKSRLNLLGIAATIVFHAVLRFQEREEEIELLRDENYKLHEQLGDNPRSNGAIIGNSKIMRQLHQMIEQVAVSDATVLILGESGVGKGMVAQSIHSMSSRVDKPFIKLNCASLPESIIESELFGHEKGAFTGAINQRLGRFEQAHGGTIFLDEIGEISLAMQAKLLRVIQEKEFERVGGQETLTCDVRILTATNRDLQKMVKEGTFREDLFYRLNVIPLDVPPLRERKSDIIQLADYFVDVYSARNNKAITRISTPAINMLTSYHWPGNVRELENAIERAIILSTDDTIHGYHLPPSLQIAERPAVEAVTEGNLQQKLDAMEYEMIIEALKVTHGNVLQASKMLGLTNRMMGNRIKKYGIDFKVYRS